jgi:hypothetical protein
MCSLENLLRSIETMAEDSSLFCVPLMCSPMNISRVFFCAVIALPSR